LKNEEKGKTTFFIYDYPNTKAKPWGFTPHPTSFLKKRSKKL